MFGPIKNYKQYCVLYKYISIISLISMGFAMYMLITAKDSKMTTVYITQVIILFGAYFSNRMLLSICMD